MSLREEEGQAAEGGHEVHETRQYPPCVPTTSPRRPILLRLRSGRGPFLDSNGIDPSE